MVKKRLDANGSIFICHLNTRQPGHLNTRQMDAILVSYVLVRKNDEINYDGIGVISEIKMTVIEPLINNGRALQNISDVNQSRQNDDEYCHQIII